MSSDQLRSELPRHVEGVLVSAHALIHKMDQPGMTLETLQQTPAAIQFRLEVHALTLWLKDAAAQDRKLSDEQCRSLNALIGAEA